MNFPFQMNRMFGSSSPLDEFYDLFPELIFGDPNQFQTVPQLVSYIQQQLRSRHNYHSYAEQQYYIQRAQAQELEELRRMVQPSFLEPPPPQPQTRTQRQTQPQIRPRVHTNSTSFRQAVEETLNRPQQSRRETLFQRSRENEVTSLMDSIFALSGFGFGRPNVLSSMLGQVNLQNLQPVVVRPSAEQIERGSVSRNATQEDVHENCSICLDAIAVESPVRVLQPCHHIFHKTCIDTWFQRNVRCPNCNHDIREQEAAVATTTPQTTRQAPVLRPNPESSTSIDTISFTIRMNENGLLETDDEETDVDSVS
jgi:hypothetical protein